MIWVLFAALALAVVIALLWPLLRHPPAPAARVDYDLTVFRDQLAEVDRDVERGVLTAEEAEAARLEIRRRMLAAARQPAAAVREETPQARALVTAAVAVAVPFLALGLYMLVGTPQMPGQQVAQSEAHDAETDALIDKLAARMREQPDDPQGWSLLARSYRQVGRYEEAATAYRNVMRLDPKDPEGYAAFGEMTTAAAGGTVTAAARDALLQALRLDRDEPRAQFYLGLERAQANEPKTAIAIWRALTAAAPADASWLGTVRNQMGEVAQAAGIMPMSIPPRHALEVFGAAAPAPPAVQAAVKPAPQASADPTTPNVDALKGRFSAENLAMIQGMVGGLVAKLADKPDDYDGWMLLGRSYTVLSNTDGAQVAYAHALKLKPSEAAPKAQLAELMAQDGTMSPSPELVKLAADIRSANASEPLALVILGADKAKAGDSASARKLWQDALRGLPADAPLRGAIERRIVALK